MRTQALRGPSRCDWHMKLLVALSLALACGALSVAAPVAAGADRPADVQRTEGAVLELDRTKRSLVGEIAAGRAKAERSLATCRSGGKGWKRLRKVRSGSQRRTYGKGARLLWSELHRVALDRAAFEVERPAFERFLGHFQQPLADPVLQAGVDAHRHRLAFYVDSTAFAGCATFEKLMKSVRGFPGDATGDARAGDVYTKLTAYVTGRVAAATRKNWGSRYERALQAARQRLKDLGGNGGYADYFAFALALNV
jgi:hypothetical protein